MRKYIYLCMIYSVHRLRVKHWFIVTRAHINALAEYICPQNLCRIMRVCLSDYNNANPKTIHNKLTLLTHFQSEAILANPVFHIP